jgi:putative addiction module killer protein
MQRPKAFSAFCGGVQFGGASWFTRENVQVMTTFMIEVRKTAVFTAWLRGLRDIRAIARISARIDRLALGNFGDAKPIGEGVSELRVDYGPGYRIYFHQRGIRLVVLLCGGDRSRQKDDIARAKALAAENSNDD